MAICLGYLVFDIPYTHSGTQLTCNKAKSKRYEIFLCMTLSI